MKIKDIIKSLENIVPLSLAEKYDNVGLIVGDAGKEVSAILSTLDITISVIKEALAQNVNFIISHHPIWFRPRKNLIGDDFPSEVILFAIENHISLYACHTNLDNVEFGINRGIVDAIGLKNTKILLPKRETNYSDTKATQDQLLLCSSGSGMIGSLIPALPVKDFLIMVKEKFQCTCIRYTETNLMKIEKVAVCGGAGSFLLEETIKQKADAFLSSDFTYHRFFDTRGKILCLDIGHYESEQFASHIIKRELEKLAPQIRTYISKINTNPIKYFI